MPASGPAGSVLAYRPDVYHRGTAMTSRAEARFLLHVAYRPADADWVGFHTWPVAGEGFDWHRFVPHASVRQLTVLGFPEPGHPYWTPETLAGVGARYPSLDMAPWAAAAAGSGTSRLSPRRRGRRRRADGRSVVADRCPLPGVPPVVRRLGRRRGRRPGRASSTTSTTWTWLGVDGLWLGPVTVSPNADWGYDVADYLAVDPELGTLDDLDRLIAEAGRRGIRVLLDLVPNHTSDQHPWFVDSRSSHGVAPPELVRVGRPADPTGRRPNNWVSSFGGPAWTLDEGTGQYYLHNHLVEQPDLNWWERGGPAWPSTTSSPTGSTGGWPASASTCAT